MAIITKNEAITELKKLAGNYLSYDEERGVTTTLEEGFRVKKVLAYVEKIRRYARLIEYAKKKLEAIVVERRRIRYVKELAEANAIRKS